MDPYTSKSAHQWCIDGMPTCRPTAKEKIGQIRKCLVRLK